MLRNIVGSWLFAAFLVVVAVGTWRVLDARRSCSACPRQAVAEAVVEAPAPVVAPIVVAPPPVEVVARAHTCGAASADLDVGPQALDPQELFLGSVSAFREGRVAEGCRALVELEESTSPASPWHKRAVAYKKQRCD